MDYREFKKKYKELDDASSELLVKMREGHFDDVKGEEVKKIISELLHQTILSDEGRKVAAISEITSLVLEELSGFACETSDDDAQTKAFDLHDEIANTLYLVGNGALKKEEKK